MYRILYLAIVILAGLPIYSQNGIHSISIAPNVTANNECVIQTLNSSGNEFHYSGQLTIDIDDVSEELTFVNGKAKYQLADDAKNVVITKGNQLGKQLYVIRGDTVRPISGWLSLLPPLFAILLALVFREVVVSLFSGIWLGTWILNGFSFSGIVSSFLAVVEHYVIGALNDSDHLAVVVFSMLIGGMVAVISRNGGMKGVVNKLSKYADSARNSQLVTWCLGVAIFFDDYANTLIVGNTMRPVTDKHLISREKLAYIVDSTAAPVAAIAFVTTWIGAELGYIDDAIQVIGLEQSAYSMFLNSLTYSFYPILTLSFILFLIFTNRDFGTMWKAENRARTTGKLYDDQVERGNSEVDNALEELQPKDGIPHLAYNALIPIIMVVAGTFAGILITGYSAETWNDNSLGFFMKLSQIVGDSNSYTALLWSSCLGATSAILLSIGTKSLNVLESIETLIDGFKTMMPAIIILILAWSLAQITKDLYTADYLTSMVSGNLSPIFIPVITFILAALISFATGSSWGTMAILYPLVLPACWSVCQSAGMEVSEILPLFYNTIACVLTGSVLGDHCSPISDTTILSSLATSCNHIDHVRTQLPYALTVGAVCILSCFVSSVFPSLALPMMVVGGLILFGIVRYFGKPVPIVANME